LRAVALALVAGSLHEPAVGLALQQTAGRNPAVVEEVAGRVRERSLVLKAAAVAAAERLAEREEAPEDEDGKKEPFPWLLLAAVGGGILAYQTLLDQSVRLGELLPFVNFAVLMAVVLVGMLKLSK
jgi:hypothetical protein